MDFIVEDGREWLSTSATGLGAETLVPGGAELLVGCFVYQRLPSCLSPTGKSRGSGEVAQKGVHRDGGRGERERERIRVSWKDKAPERC